ncbi:MAG: lipoyl(octanoyl) transferase LipB [Cytophagales bacterium]|nr:lipoyl(octanoyl) transferase LipB [Armatimonadota bacterium]
MTDPRIVSLLSEGPIPYPDAWERQRKLVALRQQEKVPDTVLLLEHPPTVTYGKASDPSHRLLTPEEYAARGIALIETDRGGDVTYHGPGQLVCYPILHLGEGRRDLHRYVRALESVIIAAARTLGVAGAERAPWHAGVWVGDGYLAALGVKVSRWVTHHGFALNVSESVRDGFATIIPCGVAGKKIATLSSLAAREVSLSETAEAITGVFTMTMDAYFERSNPL